MKTLCCAPDNLITRLLKWRAREWSFVILFIVKSHGLSISILAVLLLLTGCRSVPQTGRSQLSLVSDSQLASLSAQQFGQLKRESKLVTSGEQYEMVQRVGRRIAAVAGPDVPNANWEFILIDDNDMVNAFAMPGGKVAIYTGIFQAAQSEDDLAVVMGHEVAHVSARHGAERVSQQRLSQIGLSAAAIGVGFSDMDNTDRQLLMAGLGAGAAYGFILPYSRLHESEADEIGLMYAARAGYDPRAAIGFWQRMDQLSQGAPPEFLSTHPSGTTRISDLQKLMPKAIQAYEQSPYR